MTGPILAEFASEAALVDAARRLREAGYRRLELFSPYPVAGADELLGLRRPRLPRAAGAAGLAGAALALGVQWFTSAWDYPLNVGGRPLLSLPAWVPITFELGILAAAFGAVLGLLAGARLPRLWDPLFEVESFQRATIDRFWLEVSPSDPRFDPERTLRELEALRALRIVVGPEEG